MPGQVKKESWGDCVLVFNSCMMAHINVTSVSQMASERRESGRERGVAGNTWGLETPVPESGFRDSLASSLRVCVTPRL
uniref:Uncharacterized protein n=1 Tax=Oryza punctata TaxID=4537 RepID=A0A0E0JFQ3_ORYPU